MKGSDFASQAIENFHRVAHRPSGDLRTLDFSESTRESGFVCHNGSRNGSGNPLEATLRKLVHKRARKASRRRSAASAIAMCLLCPPIENKHVEPNTSVLRHRVCGEPAAQGIDGPLPGGPGVTS